MPPRFHRELLFRLVCFDVRPADGRFGLLESLWPFERRGLRRIVAFHMPGEPGGWLGVNELGVPEYFPAECRQGGVIRDEFRTAIFSSRFNFYKLAH